jgi:hypothetical protein
LGFEEPEALFEHYVAAGKGDRAAVYAARAANRAFAALAFDRAALLYQRALELGTPGLPDPTTLRARLGDALASAGRCPAAAQAYLEAAQSAPGEALEYQRRAAEQLLIGGHLDAGLAVIRTVLRSVGLKLAATQRRALVSLLWWRAALRLRGLGFRERPAAEIPARDLTRIDTCWAVGMGLGLIDPIRAADFQARHLLLALQAGEPDRIARGLALEAGFTSTRGKRSQRRAAQLLQAARRLGERIHSERALALCALMAAVGDYYQGRWESARAFAERAEQMLLECGGVPWEISAAHLYQANACYQLGDIRELARRSRAFLARARERGNLFASYSMRSGFSNLLWLAEDDVAGAERALEEAVREWHQEEFGVPHYLAMIARSHIHLYLGRTDLAWEVVSREWPGLASSVLLRIQLIRINARDLRARCALAAAAVRANSAPFVAVAERDVRRLEREGLPWSDALALLRRAGLCALRGKRADALALLRQAAAAFEAAKMALQAQVARRRLGQILQGAEGRSLVEGADEWMRGQGIRNAARFIEVFAPGFTDVFGAFSA